MKLVISFVTLIVLALGLSGFGSVPEGFYLVLESQNPVFEKQLGAQAQKQGIEMLTTPIGRRAEIPQQIRVEGKVSLQAYQSGMDTPFGKMGLKSGFQAAWAEANLLFYVAGASEPDHQIFHVFGSREWSTAQQLYEALSDEIVVQIKGYLKQKPKTVSMPTQ